jgi:hypothetical protein
LPGNRNEEKNEPLKENINDIQKCLAVFNSTDEQIIDFRKNKKTSLNKEAETNIIQTLYTISTFPSKNEAKKRNINYTFSSRYNGKYLYRITNSLKVYFQHFYPNAFKYTPDNREIKVNYIYRR